MVTTSVKGSGAEAPSQMIRYSTYSAKNPPSHWGSFRSVSVPSRRGQLARFVGGARDATQRTGLLDVEEVLGGKHRLHRVVVSASRPFVCERARACLGQHGHVDEDEAEVAEDGLGGAAALAGRVLVVHGHKDGREQEAQQDDQAAHRRSGTPRRARGARRNTLVRELRRLDDLGVLARVDQEADGHGQNPKQRRDKEEQQAEAL